MASKQGSHGACVQGQLNLSRGHIICPKNPSGTIYLSKTATLFLLLLRIKCPRPPGHIHIVHWRNHVLRRQIELPRSRRPASL
jgi:hypothetical protein